LNSLQRSNHVGEGRALRKCGSREREKPSPGKVETGISNLTELGVGWCAKRKHEQIGGERGQTKKKIPRQAKPGENPTQSRRYNQGQKGMPMENSGRRLVRASTLGTVRPETNVHHKKKAERGGVTPPETRAMSGKKRRRGKGDA